MNEEKPQTEVKAKYTLGEEIANAITHGLGTLLSAAGLALMIVFAVIYGNPWHIVSVSIFGATMILLYLMSTLYHAITNKTAKAILRVFDHSSVFLLIAGTYTPFTLVVLNGVLGWTLFGVVWGLTIFGIIFQALFMDKYKVFTLVMYITMGWIVIFGIGDVIKRLPPEGMFWLALGGFLYTLGTVFYALGSKVKYFHTIWHLFVLAGSICHFFCIMWYVIPMKV